MPRSPAVRRKTAAAALAALLGAAACAPPPFPSAPSAAGAERPVRVVIISIDGLRPDAIEKAGARNLRAMMREGAWTLRARTILPSKTLPSHTSMLTGVGPEVHGITWNEDQVGERGTVGVPTVFDLAQAAGRSTGAVFAKPKFRHLIRADVPRWRTAPRGAELWSAARVAQDAEAILRYRRPDLMFVHLPDPDVAGHTVGWMSPPYRWAVRRADAAVGRVVAAARRAYGDDFVVIVTADHGGHGLRHGSDAESDVQIPWIVWGRGVAPGEIAGEVRTMDTAATTLWLLGLDVPPAWAGRPVAAAFAPGPALAR